MEPAIRLKPFPLGQIMFAPKAQELLNHQEVVRALRRHARGDWGEVRAEQAAENELAWQEGRCVVSRYRDAAGRPFYVLTDARRSMTFIVTGLDR